MPKFIALAEDDSDDQLLFAEAMKQICKKSSFRAVTTGKELLDMLNADSVSLPDVVVLDVNLPGMSGIECLKIIQTMPRFSNLPIVVMSTSGDEETIEEAFRHGADSYAVKPGKFDDLKAVVEKIIVTDWISIRATRTRDNFMIRPHLAIR